MLSVILRCAALLTVSEEVRSRCSLKHRKSLLISDVTMENVSMDTFSVYHSDPGCRYLISSAGFVVFFILDSYLSEMLALLCVDCYHLAKSNGETLY